MIRLEGTLSKAFLADRLGVTFGRDYYLDPVKRRQTDLKCFDYTAEHYSDMELFYNESNLGQKEYIGRNQVLIGGIQPNLILGVLLGAEFVPQDKLDADIRITEPMREKLLSLPAPESLLAHEWIPLFDSQIQQARQAGMQPIPPFFWDRSGRATIHGAMTTAHKFLGETFFMDMLTDPEKCEKILQWITQAHIVLIRHFAEQADFPITCVHIGECSACMLDPDNAERFVVPSASTIGQQLGGVRLHSCGSSTHLLDAFAKITNLTSLDLGGDTDLAKVRHMFGPGFPVSIMPMPQDMSAEDTQPIIDWAKAKCDENAGGDLLIIYHIEPDYNLETIRALVEFVKNSLD